MFLLPASQLRALAFQCAGDALEFLLQLWTHDSRTQRQPEGGQRDQRQWRDMPENGSK